MRFKNMISSFFHQKDNDLQILRDVRDDLAATLTGSNAYVEQWFAEYTEALQLGELEEFRGAMERASKDAGDFGAVGFHLGNLLKIAEGRVAAMQRMDVNDVMVWACGLDARLPTGLSRSQEEALKAALAESVVKFGANLRPDFSVVRVVDSKALRGVLLGVDRHYEKSDDHRVFERGLALEKRALDASAVFSQMSPVHAQVASHLADICGVDATRLNWYVPNDLRDNAGLAAYMQSMTQTTAATSLKPPKI